MFSAEDLRQIRLKGLNPQIIGKQLERFRQGFPFITLDRPAVPGDGIIVFPENNMVEFVDYFEKNQPALQVIKFVPASGAASRMFRHLFEFRERFTPTEECFNELFFDKSFNSVYYFFQNIEKFAFFSDLKSCLDRDHLDYPGILDRQELDLLIDYLLNAKGLNYNSLPKALLKFHNYPDGPRIAAEEHLVEAINYACNNDRIASIHFTLSPEHIEKFLNKIEEVKRKYQEQFNINFKITWSVQKPSTDIIAVDENNEPFRNDDGTLLFRPGGHGALLENLNELDAGIIFIKNIDNVVPDHLKDQTFRYKKLLGGYLLWLRDRIYSFLRESDIRQLNEAELDSMAYFTRDHCMIDLSPHFDTLDLREKQSFLTNLLNRPIRVCGMVRNEGEPGGGPFWVTDGTERPALQIVESSQVNHENNHQENIFASATHFNPVDLVCCIKDHKGKHFNLGDYSNEATGFISQKSSEGRTLKAQELPGLWNGAMAHWLTLFIEVPISTFNPVKTINDLLREEHQ